MLNWAVFLASQKGTFDVDCPFFVGAESASVSVGCHSTLPSSKRANRREFRAGRIPCGGNTSAHSRRRISLLLTWRWIRRTQLSCLIWHETPEKMRVLPRKKVYQKVGDFAVGEVRSERGIDACFNSHIAVSQSSPFRSLTQKTNEVRVCQGGLDRFGTHAPRCY